MKAVILFLILSASSTAYSIEIGVLEQAENHGYWIPIFKANSKGQWTAWSFSAPTTFKQKITFDGRVIGEIEAKVTYCDPTPLSRLAKILPNRPYVNQNSVHHCDTIVMAESGEYKKIAKKMGYRKLMFDGEKVEPFITTDLKNFTDPEGWLRGRSKNDEARLLKAASRKHNEKSKLKDIEYKISEFFRSKNGQYLVKIEPAKNIQVLGLGRWFYFAKIDAVPRAYNYLDEGSSLVDIGDYDGDGKSEAIFLALKDYRFVSYYILYEKFTRMTEAFVRQGNG